MSEVLSVLLGLAGLSVYWSAAKGRIRQRSSGLVVPSALCVVEGTVPGFTEQWTNGVTVTSRGALTFRPNRSLRDRLRRRGGVEHELRPVDVWNTGAPPEDRGWWWDPTAVVVELDVPGGVLEWAVSAHAVPEAELRLIQAGTREHA